MFKKILLVSVFLICSNSFAESPTCKDGSWYLNGYLFFTGGENCTNLVAACSDIGTKNEGWYSFPKKSERLLGYAICKNDLQDGYAPTCEYAGTRSEGWYVAGNMVSWSKCSSEESVCLHQGTQQEGWYSFPKNSKHRITWDKCINDI